MERVLDRKSLTVKVQIALWVLWGAVLVGPAAAEDPVYFADTVLKAAVEETLWINDPTPSDMLGLTELVWLNSSIKDLTGLEYASHLQSLYLRYNQITDLSPLSGLTLLQSMDLSRNQITDLTPLDGLTGLLSLDLHQNRISDLAPLAGLTQLQYLTLRENRLTNIVPLAGLTNLLYLNIPFNQVCDLSPLANLYQIQTLELYGNYFNSLSSLLELKNLANLRVGWTDLGDNAYCSDLQTILNNNPGLFLEYDPNPSPPTGISASDGTYPDKVRVSWEPVCNGPSYTSYYRVSRASSQDGPKTPISPWQTACSFDDTSALAGTPYYYCVQTASSSQGLNAGNPSTPDAGWR